MGNLASSRLEINHPFSNTGVDYCGSFMLREHKFGNFSKIKAYIAFFVSFTTKAIHCELVTDLSTETCLSAIDDFLVEEVSPRIFIPITEQILLEQIMKLKGYVLIYYLPILINNFLNI